MTIKSHPQYLPPSLEATYKVLRRRAQNGVVRGTYRQLMDELGLKSPAPLLCRLKQLLEMGVIEMAS
jgi:DNA-binding Lrp family transcriptional regulator